MPNPIILINGVKSGDVLDLSDNGETVVNSGSEFRLITWELNSDDVRWFYIVAKKGDNPFETGIPKTYRKKHKLKVKDKHPELDWEYAIVWLDANNDKHTHDPKIAIRSSFVPRKQVHKWSWKSWLGLGFGLLGIALLLADKKKRSR